MCWHDESGAHARQNEKMGSRVRGILILTALVAWAMVASGCATGGRGFGVKAAVDVGAPGEASVSAAVGTWAAHQVRVVVLAKGDAGWPTAFQGATVRAFDPATATLHEAVTGPDGAVTFQSRGPLELWVRPTAESAPEVITWAPRPADDVGNQFVLTHTLKQ